MEFDFLNIYAIFTIKLNFRKMEILEFIKSFLKYNKKKEDSDLKKIKITSSGAFYMTSKDLFNDKQKSLELLEKLNKSVENHNKSRHKVFSHSE